MRSPGQALLERVDAGEHPGRQPKQNRDRTGPQGGPLLVCVTGEPASSLDVPVGEGPARTAQRLVIAQSTYPLLRDREVARVAGLLREHLERADQRALELL